MLFTELLTCVEVSRFFWGTLPGGLRALGGVPGLILPHILYGVAGVVVVMLYLVKWSNGTDDQMMAAVALVVAVVVVVVVCVVAVVCSDGIGVICDGSAAGWW
jgi:hypothetical protein